MSAAPTQPPTRTPGGNARPASKPGAVSFGEIAEGTGHRIVFYGTGGIGKTTSAALAPGPVAFFDLENSLPRLRESFVTSGLKLDIRPVNGIETWQDIRNALHAPGWDDIKTIVLDSATLAEELAVAHTLETVPNEKRQQVTSVEGYGFGKGYGHVFETFLELLADLEQHARAGRHVILVCHELSAPVPNPGGDDWTRWEPRLQAVKNGPIRSRVKEWADHVLYLQFDVSVDGKGKATGCGSRTLYFSELPSFTAKSRTLADPIPIAKFDTTLWTQLLK